MGDLVVERWFVLVVYLLFLGGISLNFVGFVLWQRLLTFVGGACYVVLCLI